MIKNLSLKEYKNLLKFYDSEIPNNLYSIKRKANKLIIKKMCISNCNDCKKYKYLFSKFFEL